MSKKFGVVLKNSLPLMQSTGIEPIEKIKEVDDFFDYAQTIEADKIFFVGKRISTDIIWAFDTKEERQAFTALMQKERKSRLHKDLRWRFTMTTYETKSDGVLDQSQAPC